MVVEGCVAEPAADDAIAMEQDSAAVLVIPGVRELSPLRRRSVNYVLNSHPRGRVRCWVILVVESDLVAADDGGEVMPEPTEHAIATGPRFLIAIDLSRSIYGAVELAAGAFTGPAVFREGVDVSDTCFYIGSARSRARASRSARELRSRARARAQRSLVRVTEHARRARQSGPGSTKSSSKKTRARRSTFE